MRNTLDPHVTLYSCFSAAAAAGGGRLRLGPSEHFLSGWCPSAVLPSPPRDVSCVPLNVCLPPARLGAPVISLPGAFPAHLDTQHPRPCGRPRSSIRSPNPSAGAEHGRSSGDEDTPALGSLLCTAQERSPRKWRRGRGCAPKGPRARGVPAQTNTAPHLPRAPKTGCTCAEACT